MQLVSIIQRTKEWLEFRRSHVCASDSPIIMGHSPYKTIQKLYDEKLKCYEQPVTEYMQRGIDLEPIALKEFEKETGLIMFPCVGKHDEIEWMAASFDGMTIEGDTICEIKCPGKKDHSEACLGLVPNKYKSQLQHQMYVSGVQFMFYYSFDGEKGVIIEVKRDQEFIEIMLEKEREFWNCLQTFTPPTITLKQKRQKYAAGVVS